MSVQDRGTAYNNALTEAYGDLETICARLAELEGRKSNIEKATAALQALMGASEAAVEPARPAPFTARPVVEISTPSVPQSRESGGKFENHIRQVLGMAATA
ncbi:MAG TPA: hypothetical protein VE291_07815 [Terracidiphilus sp.]|jgi:hypothetical protein|nr:hypothetical protein [Terracidiphilus sp.]